MPPSPKPLQHLLREGPLMALQRQALEQQSWLHAVRELLPEALRPACLSCVPKGDLLVIQMKSSSYATLIRFQAPALLKALAERKGQAPRRIEVRTHVGVTPKVLTGSLRRPCSRQTTEHLRDYADQVGSDDMAMALRRLADTLEQRGIPRSDASKGRTSEFKGT